MGGGIRKSQPRLDVEGGERKWAAGGAPHRPHPDCSADSPCGLNKPLRSQAFLHGDARHPCRVVTTALRRGRCYLLTFQNNRVALSERTFQGETNVCPAPSVWRTLRGFTLPRGRDAQVSPPPSLEVRRIGPPLRPVHEPTPLCPISASPVPGTQQVPRACLTELCPASAGW